ncbi:MAG: hypothetical protein ABWY25_10975 [Paenisporosarcina sp.]
MTKTYSELINYETFEDRLEYLRLDGSVGAVTFGFDRYINQDFYRSAQWKYIREAVIVRDNGCDLGVPGHDIYNNFVVHHINPMTSDNIVHGDEWILDSEYLITTNKDTHNMIHYGFHIQKSLPMERANGDTKLW